MYLKIIKSVTGTMKFALERQKGSKLIWEG